MSSRSLLEVAALLDTVSQRLVQFSTIVPKPFAGLDESMVRRLFFAKPGAVHYMVLAMARALSGSRAAIEIYRSGYYLESMTLLRSIVENQSHLNYVLAGIDARQIDQVSRDFLKGYFGDTVRRSGERAPHTYLSQKEIHRRIAKAFKANQAKYLDPYGMGSTLDEKEVSDNLSRLYNVFSNFLHGRYPEMMTMYGYNSLKVELSGAEGWHDPSVDNELFYELADIIRKDMKLCVLKALTADPDLSMPNQLRSWAFSDIF